MNFSQSSLLRAVARCNRKIAAASSAGVVRFYAVQRRSLLVQLQALA